MLSVLFLSQQFKLVLKIWFNLIHHTQSNLGFRCFLEIRLYACFFFSCNLQISKTFRHAKLKTFLHSNLLQSLPLSYLLVNLFHRIFFIAKPKFTVTLYFETTPSAVTLLFYATPNNEISLDYRCFTIGDDVRSFLSLM